MGKSICNFKSGIVLQDLREKGGFRLLMLPWTESHRELELLFNLRDAKRLNYAKVEFSPRKLATADKVETYKLSIDEERRPDWFGGEMQEKVVEKMSAYIKSIIVTGDVVLLVGGQFILAAGAKVECAHSMVINAMLDKSSLNYMSGGTLNYMGGGTLNYMGGGTINYMGGGTINYMGGGTIKKIQDVWSPEIKKTSSAAQILEDTRKK